METTTRNPILIADNVRGIYGPKHAAYAIERLTEQGWVFSDLVTLVYARQDPEGQTWKVEQAEGGDIFLMPA
jgi:hypothetical protein